MRILIINQQFLSPGDPGFSRLNEYSERWTQEGFKVIVIASQVNYMTGRRNSLSGNPIFNRRKLENGIEVIRTYMPSAYQKSVFKKIVSLVMFTISATIAIFLVKRPDVILISSPPLFLAVTALTASYLFRVPFVFDIRDLWPESGYSLGILKRGSLFARVLEELEMMTAKKASAINTLTPAFRDDIISRGLANIEKVKLIPNGVDIEKIKKINKDFSVLRKQFGWDRHFVVVYTGAHSIANYLEQLIDAAERLAVLPEVLICCFGDGLRLPALRKEVERKKLINIRFYGPVSKEDALKAIVASDVCVAVLKNAPAFHKVYPNKIFEYMAFSKPIIVAIDGAARRLIEESRAGVYTPPENPASFVEVVRRLKNSPSLCRQMGENGREFVEKHFSLEALYRKMTSLLKDIARS